MYTVAFLIRRKRGMSREAFLRYYEEKHGPLMVEMAKDRGLVSHEHYPVQVPPEAQDGAAMFDAFSIYVFESKAQADACWALPEVAADGRAFIDIDEMVELVVARRGVFEVPARES